MKAPKFKPGWKKAIKYAGAAHNASVNAARMREILGDRSEWPLKKILRTGIVG